MGMSEKFKTPPPGRRRVALVLLAAALLLGIAFAAGKMMFVSVEKGVIRSSASHMAQVVETLPYGAQVTIVSQQGAWFEVSYGAAKGFMHSSALMADGAQALKAGASDAKTGVSSGEVSMAGKGFTPEVERNYKSQNPNLRYDLVDKMETMKVSDSKKLNFVESGNLQPGKGGAK